MPIEQTGDYELFLYTFATDGDPPAGDTLYGGTGDDTIIAGTADDTIAAQLPKDTIIHGSGTVTLESGPRTSTSPWDRTSTSTRASVTLIGSFLDPPATPPTPTTGTSSRRTARPLPTGTGPSFTFIPGNAGTYAVTYTVSDANGGGARPRWWSRPTPSRRS